MNTLVINYSFEPIEVISWEKAVYLLYTKKAETISSYDKIVRSVSTSLNIPKVIRLVKYFKYKQTRRINFRKKDVFLRDDWTCQYCLKKLNEKTATVDHVIPRAQNGRNNLKNTVTACYECNSTKANRTPEQAGMKLVKRPEKPSDFRIFERRLGYELKVAFQTFIQGENLDES